MALWSYAVRSFSLFVKNFNLGPFSKLGSGIVSVFHRLKYRMWCFTEALLSVSKQKIYFRNAGNILMPVILEWILKIESKPELGFEKDSIVLLRVSVPSVILCDVQQRPLVVTFIITQFSKNHFPQVLGHFAACVCFNLTWFHSSWKSEFINDKGFISLFSLLDRVVQLHETSLGAGSLWILELKQDTLINLWLNWYSFWKKNHWLEMIQTFHKRENMSQYFKQINDSDDKEIRIHIFSRMTVEVIHLFQISPIKLFQQSLNDKHILTLVYPSEILRGH